MHIHYRVYIEWSSAEHEAPAKTTGDAYPVETALRCYASGEAARLSTERDGFESRTARHFRSVAQPGSALCSERRGRWFKSSHSDQPRAGRPDFTQLPANATGFGARRVHQRVHQRRLRMASLRQDSRGNYVSRRKLPTDVRDEYGRLFRQRHEAKFFRPASTDRREARATRSRLIRSSTSLWS